MSANRPRLDSVETLDNQTLQSLNVLVVALGYHVAPKLVFAPSPNDLNWVQFATITPVVNQRLIVDSSRFCNHFRIVRPEVIKEQVARLVLVELGKLV